ncbi:MAG: carboxypeptidase regulatory-like domain-containing protein [Acidobacteriota bacterium]
MKRLFIALGLVGALFAGDYALAQSTTTGSIQVTVEDESGGRLPGVTVTASAADALGTRTAITDSNGTATLAGLQPSSQYVVTTALEGFSGTRNENVLVRAGQTAQINAALRLSAVEEELIVTAETPIVDVTSAVSGQDITLELTESLPTGRSYQSYLQLVPGVAPPDPSSQGGNPAARSGLNYRDIGGDLGVSRDNFYYVEGIDVTDPVTGTFGANMNTEIIQEQSVILGGIPAEYKGAPGLVSSVITKSGGNNFSGSVNYYFQDDSLVDDNENIADETFSTFDTAFTLGGPIVKDKAWFFGSFRRTEREVDVANQQTGEFLRPVTQEADQWFGKLSWTPTDNGQLSATFLNDPQERDGSFDSSTLNNRDTRREQGGDRFIIGYNHVFGALYVDAAFGEHSGEVSDFALTTDARNDILFRGEDRGTFSLEDEQLGSAGFNIVDERDNSFWRASFSYFADTSFGDHTIKGGVENEEHENFRNRLTPGDATYDSIALRYGAVTAGDLSTNDWTDLQFDPFNTSDFGGFVEAVDASGNRDAIYAALDSNGDNSLSQDEVAANLVFGSTAGNPDGNFNYDRTLQSSDGPQLTSSEGLTYYLQDTIQFGRATVNLGVRAERYEHFATTGENIFTFDWEYAPRISAIYDLTGDGSQKISAYYGRYYDPVRNNLTNFAGTLTGAIREEQVFVAPVGEWITYRTRGGPSVQDAFFAPTTKTPYTDDLQFGYQIDLGNSMSFEVNLIRRETRDIIEDYDLGLYADPAGYPGPIDDPNSLFLGLDYFGYDAVPDSNFVIATLAGGERDRDEVELVFRKRFSNNWQALVSYNWADSEGNTNSDSNADFQGDVLFLDPRAPNQLGTQPGLIENLFKAAASYRWDNGIQVGGTFRWNSGTVASETFRASARNLPIRVLSGEEFEFAGITRRWLAPGVVGALENPDWSQLDLRVQYNRDFGRFDGEFFLDVFNVFDNQDAVRNQDLVAGGEGVAFGDGLQFLDPRRYFLGARLSF